MFTIDESQRVPKFDSTKWLTYEKRQCSSLQMIEYFNMDIRNSNYHIIINSHIFVLWYIMIWLCWFTLNWLFTQPLKQMHRLQSVLSEHSVSWLPLRSILVVGNLCSFKLIFLNVIRIYSVTNELHWPNQKTETSAKIDVNQTKPKLELSLMTCQCVSSYSNTGIWKGVILRFFLSSKAI